MKYVMFEHAGSGNHGCEAIVRSTVDMLGSNEYYLQTANEQEDVHYGLDKLTYLVKSFSGSLNRNSFQGLCRRVQSRISGVEYDSYDSVYRHSLLMKKGSVALSIGGDNYCYKGIIGSIRDKLKAFEVKGIPCVLWGCSVDKDFIDDLVINDLKHYSLITARESLTVQNLEEIGIRDNVVSVSDPAFTLKRENTNWNENIFKNYEVVGINVSDFMTFYNSYPDATFRNFNVLINYLLKETEYYIALIPHVEQEGNNDLMPIRKLSDSFQNERILVMDEDYNCRQIKDVIAKCKIFIGCRTHSTIAAYSTCVPTLVVGYSVKAKGIAKDIFGDYEDQLVDVREFSDDRDLLNKYFQFSEGVDEYRKQLTSVMPLYINRAYLGKDALLRIKS